MHAASFLTPPSATYQSSILPLHNLKDLRLSSSSTSMVCTGSSRSLGTCPCPAFVPKKSKQTRCKTCGHRMVSHLDDPAPSQDELSPAEAPGKYVGRLLRSLKSTAVHDVARKETLEGFRPPPHQSAVRITKHFYCPFILMGNFCPSMLRLQPRE